MFRPAPFLLVACVLLSCSSKPKTDYKDLKSVPLHSVGLVMQLPSSFREFSLEEEIDYWENSDVRNDVIDKKIAYLESLLLSPNATQYLADSANATNDVRIMELPVYLKIGKYMSKEGFLAIDKTVQLQATVLGIKYQALENDYFSLANGNDVMKIRYRATETRVKIASLAPFNLDGEDFVYYTTFYIVSGEKTVSIVVNHQSEDFEYFIRTLRFL